jgi:hypothetical protein
VAICRGVAKMPTRPAGAGRRGGDGPRDAPPRLRQVAGKMAVPESRSCPIGSLAFGDCPPVRLPRPLHPLPALPPPLPSRRTNRPSRPTALAPYAV